MWTWTQFGNKAIYCGHQHINFDQFKDLTDLLLGLGLAAAAGAAGFFFGQTQRGRSFPLLSPFSADENPAVTILRGVTFSIGLTFTKNFLLGIDDFAKKLEDYAKE